jgi:hypothetical protein
MNLQQLIDFIKYQGIYDIRTNIRNNNVEVWSDKGVRSYNFDTESELKSFLTGVYYTSVDMLERAKHE